MQSLEKNNKAVLELSNVSKNFGGVVAAENISFPMYPGEVFGLIGPNGAGKTTLLNLICGIYKINNGKITLLGSDITNNKIHAISKKGILRTFQHPRLLENCDIKTNIVVGMDLAKKRKSKMYDKRDELLDELLNAANLSEIDINEETSKLSYGQKKLLEIVRSILADPIVLLLDEPAAGLNNKEIEYVVNLINIAKNKNIAVLLIEHSMDLVMNICDTITVLNFGKQIALGTPEEIQNNPEVIKAYLGG
ncbi:ABC transporter ATP-binding protein [Tissierella sp. Yu-01]|uniref:ABC transporter ATP-binding protein n=1 Tax=Tissierella sp. Yu-01 TaxID=3035694 RepID=UPI00240CFE54|nr:ABC transporter ATP-binding protein [Tissierella sp. Yu-01]WFA10137.1 ABC transporter ATP-binding protein [Tissierella sp. Yu-01]